MVHLYIRLYYQTYKTNYETCPEPRTRHSQRHDEENHDQDPTDEREDPDDGGEAATWEESKVAGREERTGDRIDSCKLMFFHDGLRGPQRHP